jgi:hypothetical protein
LHGKRLFANRPSIVDTALVDFLKGLLWTERFRPRNVVLSTATMIPLAFGIFMALGYTKGEAIGTSLALALGALVGGLFWGWREREKADDRPGRYLN